MKTKNQFKNLEELYNSKNYFYKFGSYVNYYMIDYSSSKPRLIYKPDDTKNEWEVIAIGLKQINKMMKLHNIEVEI